MPPKPAPKKSLAAPKPVAAPAPPIASRQPKLVVKETNMPPAVAATKTKTSPAAPAKPPKYTADQFLKLSQDELREGILNELFTPDQLLAANAILAGEKQSGKQRKFEIVQTPHGEYRKGTITHRIYEFMQLPADKAMTLEQMRDQLITEFPENGKNPDGVMTTVRCQITRQPTERGFTLGRSADGKYSVNIEGRDNSRVLSPDQQAKRDAKQKIKDDAKKVRADAKVAKAKLKADAKAAAEVAKQKAIADKAAADKLVADKAAADAAAQKAAGTPPSTVVGKAAPKATTKK